MKSFLYRWLPGIVAALVIFLDIFVLLREEISFGKMVLVSIVPVTVAIVWHWITLVWMDRCRILEEGLGKPENELTRKQERRIFEELLKGKAVLSFVQFPEKDCFFVVQCNHDYVGENFSDNAVNMYWDFPVDLVVFMKGEYGRHRDNFSISLKPGQCVYVYSASRCPFLMPTEVQITTSIYGLSYAVYTPLVHTTKVNAGSAI